MPQFGSLNRKRARSAERQIRSRSDSNFGIQIVTEQVEDLMLEGSTELAADARLRFVQFCSRLLVVTCGAVQQGRFSYEICERK